MKFDVYITKFFNYYNIEAENQDEALKIAEERFVEERCYPVADTTYDEVEIEISEN